MVSFCTVVMRIVDSYFCSIADTLLFLRLLDIGFNMSIHHNGKLDGKNKAKKWKYTTWWKYYKDEFPVAREMCDHLVKFAG